jgi:RimJ/RimL family protein N-acetyltransferase
MTDDVSLRPAMESDLPVVDVLMHDPVASSPYQWFGWQAPQHLKRRWFENGLLEPQRGLLMVVKGDERLGFVSWAKSQTGPFSTCWNVGIGLLPDARGHGYGTEAQRLLARYLFAHTTVNRLEAMTEIGNIAEQRSLEKAGFTKEGVLRGYGFRNGAYHDSVSYSILRADVTL